MWAIQRCMLFNWESPLWSMRIGGHLSGWLPLKSSTTCTFEFGVALWEVERLCFFHYSWTTGDCWSRVIFSHLAAWHRESLLKASGTWCSFWFLDVAFQPGVLASPIGRGASSASPKPLYCRRYSRCLFLFSIQFAGSVGLELNCSTIYNFCTSTERTVITMQFHERDPATHAFNFRIAVTLQLLIDSFCFHRRNASVKINS